MDQDLLQYTAMMAKLMEQYPAMLTMAKEHPRFPEIEQMVVALIANADSVADAVAAYEKYRSIVPDWKFVLASGKGPTPGLSVNRTFSDGSVIRGLFSTERVFVLDAETRQEMITHVNAIFSIDYSIALDTQSLSYLAPYIEGKTARLPDDFQEIFAFISQDNVFVDPMPYMLENLPNVLVTKNVGEIRRRLRGYEILRTIDGAHFRQTSEVRSTVSELELDNKVYSGSTI